MGLKIFYKWSFLRRFFKYSSPLVRLFESPKISRYGGMELKNAPVFIVGLPRSGSTILYQLLTDMFDVLYFDNLVNLGRENLYFSLWLSQKIYRNKQHLSYSSKYGNTTDSGLHAPSEAGELWYRWFPKEANIIDEASMPEKVKKDFSLNFSGLMNRYRKPLIIKNLYSNLRIGMLKEIFPNAKFIFIQRESIFIAQSIYLARKNHGIDPDSGWWSLKYPGYETIIGLPVEEQIAHQVYNLNRIVKEELTNIPEENVLQVRYEDLNIEEVQKNFQDFLGANLKPAFHYQHVNFKQENAQKVSDEIFAKLKAELKKLSLSDN